MLFWQFSILATCNFGNLQFWHLAILATCNFDNFQSWQFSILAIFKQNFWINPTTTSYQLYGSCDQGGTLYKGVHYLRKYGICTKHSYSRLKVPLNKYFQMPKICYRNFPTIAEWWIHTLLAVSTYLMKHFEFEIRSR